MCYKRDDLNFEIENLDRTVQYATSILYIIHVYNTFEPYQGCPSVLFQKKETMHHVVITYMFDMDCKSNHIVLFTYDLSLIHFSDIPSGKLIYKSLNVCFAYLTKSLIRCYLIF